MIQTTIIPNNTTVSITIPKDYVGKKVIALCYTEEEILPVIEEKVTKKPSDFFGTLSLEEGKKMHDHAMEARKEWSRDI